ncbi:hypothetical protein BH10PSE6_BH10PSE6_58300 [soil metagenome]
MRFVMGILDFVELSRPVIDLPDGRAFATGNGPHDYLCGGCGNVLFAGLELPDPPKVTVVCGKCRTPNGMTFTEAM